MRLATAIVALSATVALAAPAERWSTPCGGHVGTCLIEKSKYNVHKKSRPVLKNECICRMLKEHPECAKEGYTCAPLTVPLPPPVVAQSPPGVPASRPAVRRSAAAAHTSAPTKRPLTPTVRPSSPWSMTMDGQRYEIRNGLLYNIIKKQFHADFLDKDIEKNKRLLASADDIETRLREVETHSDAKYWQSRLEDFRAGLRRRQRELHACLAYNNRAIRKRDISANDGTLTDENTPSKIAVIQRDVVTNHSPSSSLPSSAPSAPKRYGIHVDDGFHGLDKGKCDANRLEEQIEENDENLEQVEELKTRFNEQRKDHTPLENAEMQANISEMETRFRTKGRELRARLANCKPDTSTPDIRLPDTILPDTILPNTILPDISLHDINKRDISATLPEHPLMNNMVLSKFDKWQNGADIATRWVEPSHGKSRRERNCIMRYANQDGRMTKNERVWQLDFCMNNPDVPVRQDMPEGWAKKARMTDVDQPTENCFRFKLGDGFWTGHCKNGEGDTRFGRGD